MPGIARKILICAAVDGLLIQPLATKSQQPPPAVQIKYGVSSVSQVPRDSATDDSKPSSSFEAFGVVGLITVSRLSYLITITRRHQVAQVFGFPIYVVTEVAVTPCSSQSAAEDAVAKTSLQLRSRTADKSTEDSDSSDDELEVPNTTTDDVEDALQGGDVSRAGSTPTGGSGQSSIAEDVIGRKGSYGRFAQKWFSKAGWTQDQKRNLGLSDATTAPTADAKEAAKPAGSIKIPFGAEDAGSQASALLPKLLKTAQILFGSSKSFYFSYDFDLTRSFATRSPAQPEDRPLCELVDPMYFWNRNALKPFLNARQESLVLPIMQGFVGQRSFVMDEHPAQTDDGMAGSLELTSFSPGGSVPGTPPVEKSKEESELKSTEKPFLMTIISRRSTKRAGLRYLRRGIDEDGNVANAVQTEQILSSLAWGEACKIYSFLQIRGSIPLYFTQTPYSLRPVPVIRHSLEANYIALQKHFQRITKDYSQVHVVSLVEKHGVEAQIGKTYQREVERFNEENPSDKPVGFEWFDFHDACRGMKFENVSLLLDKMRPTLEEFGSTIEEGGKAQQKQGGVLRTNCMDCLDRTNVCQSSFAKYMLEVQLKQEGIDMSAQLDQDTRWFNTLWADNGDAISKQYASTAAMKGDYTRTKKRNLGGAFNDLGLSLARFYNGMVNDYFSQAAIDFLLGNVTSLVFDEFESDMMTKDPAVSMAKMREQAVELCQRRVVADEREEFVGGWAMLSPRQPGAVKSPPFEEVIFLLTDTAMYLCRFDWHLDKVSSFERADLAHVTGIRFGTYITSTVSAAHLDELRNVGLVVSYQPGKDDITRTNTRTLSSFEGSAPKKRASAGGKGVSGRPTSLATLLGGRSAAATAAAATRKIALKAPYATSSSAAPGEAPRMTEIQQVVTICAEIERLAFMNQPRTVGRDRETMIEGGDIISVEEAKRSTGLLEQLGHSIKKLVWA